ncbi:hypothetical protein ACFY1P_23655 [Streptomyces sp. NPDC001407]|uniref:hypothetical protein n=1 Tax=unclassified Streptomyces TaxID=2593676 RepID=UPI0034062CA8
MVDQGVVVTVEVRPSPVTAWFHRLLTHPVIEVDNRAYTAKWGFGTEEITVPAGVHRINVYFRYRGQKSARLAEAGREFSAEPAARRVEITARLGVRNGSRFRIGDPVPHG